MKLLKRAMRLILPPVIAIVLSACSLLPSLAQNSSAASALPEHDKNAVSFPAAGYSLRFTKVFSDYASEGVFSYSEAQNGKEQNGTPYVHKLYADFMPYETLEIINEMEQNADALTKEQKDENLKKIYASLKNVFFVTVYNKETLQAALAGGKDISEVTGCTDNRLVGEQEGLVYYFSVTNAPLDELSAQSQKAYKALQDGIPDILQGVTLFKPQKE
ncbi:hypothetical protein [Acetanaerobacterium elongatum]|uniref:Lipoprotein n=1 Tax=Acetanaerobacterium elongatum TaxID=258515 RepID=A0A1G9TYS6_9FIRM|nr:hypothetical protein [Acetanaerobacterium elongatum]SDM52832.1 hypothetical protein SAMN05192585_10124 [Acetanaerobacterium elongatum]